MRFVKKATTKMFVYFQLRATSLAWVTRSKTATHPKWRHIPPFWYVAYLVVSKTGTKPKWRQIRLDFSQKRCVYLYPKWGHAKTATNRWNGSPLYLICRNVLDTIQFYFERRHVFNLSPRWIQVNMAIWISFVHKL